jgi:hypothetical protein
VLGVLRRDLQSPEAGLNRPAPRSLRLRAFLGKVAWATLLSISIGALIMQVLPASQGVNDFCQDYVAAQRLLHGAMPYLPLRAPGGPALCFGLLSDAHPPFSILFLLPLALFPQVLAATLWGMVSLACYILSGLLIARELGWPKLRSLALFMSGSLLWSAAVLATDTENLGHIVTVLLVGAWVLDRRQRHVGAGALLGVAGLLKLWPIALLGYALLWRKGRLAWWALVTFAGGLALSLLVVGPAAFAAYLGPVQADERLAVAANANTSLDGALARLFIGFNAQLPLPPLFHMLSLPEAVLLAEAMGALLLIAALLLLWRQSRRVQPEVGEPLALGVLIVVLLLVFPVTWFWGLVTLILPGATLLLALRRLPRPPVWWYAVLALGLIPLLLPGGVLLAIPEWVLSFDNPRLLLLAHLLTWLPTCGLVLFAGAQAWLLCWAAKQRPAVVANQASEVVD